MGDFSREEEAVAHAVGRRGIEGEHGGRAACAQSRPVAGVLEKAKVFSDMVADDYWAENRR